MSRVNFETIVTILALHIDKDTANELYTASCIEDARFNTLVKLAEAPIMSTMHDAYEHITSESSKTTPLNVYPIFVGALQSYLKQNNFDTLGHFLHSVHSEMVSVVSQLARVGITVVVHKDGIMVSSDKGKLNTLADVEEVEAAQDKKQVH